MRCISTGTWIRQRWIQVATHSWPHGRIPQPVHCSLLSQQLHINNSTYPTKTDNSRLFYPHSISLQHIPIVHLHPSSHPQTRRRGRGRDRDKTVALVFLLFAASVSVASQKTDKHAESSVSPPSSPLSGNVSGNPVYVFGRGDPTPSRVSLLSSNPTVNIACGGHQCLLVDATGAVYSYDNSDVRVVPFPSDVHAVSASCSDSHCAVIDDQGRVWMWATFRKSSPFPFTPTLISQHLPHRIVNVKCGRFHTLLLDETGSVYSMGKTDDGSCALSETYRKSRSVTSPVLVDPALFGKSRVVDIAAGNGFSLFLTESSVVYGCGSNVYGQLAQPLTAPRSLYTPTVLPFPFSPSADVRIIAVFAGEYHCCFVSSDRQLWTVGKADEGQIGCGQDCRAVFNPVLRPVKGLDDGRVLDCALGMAHSAAIVGQRDGERQLFVWGRGREGQLGRNDHLESVVAYRDVPVPVTALTPAVPLKVALGDEQTMLLVKC